MIDLHACQFLSSSRLRSQSSICILGSPKPAIFIEGGIHAREWISPATVTFIIRELVINPKYFLFFSCFFGILFDACIYFQLQRFDWDVWLDHHAACQSWWLRVFPHRGNILGYPCKICFDVKITLWFLSRIECGGRIVVIARQFSICSATARALTLTGTLPTVGVSWTYSGEEKEISWFRILSIF